MSTDVYLQANQAAAAVKFYTAVGFKKCPTNTIESLPVDWHDRVNQDNIQDFYLKFIDNETNMREAKLRASERNEEVNPKEFLHLMKLDGPIKTLHYPMWDDQSQKMSQQDISHQVVQQILPLIPPNDGDIMFRFPYKDVGQRFDVSTADLKIFGNKLFHFADESYFLTPEEMDSSQDKTSDKQYKGSMITKLNIVRLKDKSAKYKSWLHNEHLNLTCQWFLRNSASPASDSFEVIQSDFVQVLTSFYQMMMNADGTRNKAKCAFDMHWFLMKKSQYSSNIFYFLR